jgi:hypothetical protein
MLSDQRLFSHRRLPLQTLHALRVTGYEPQRSGVLGDKQPAHFTFEEIPRIPSRSNRSPEPRILAKRIACHHPRSPRAFPPHSAFVGPPSRSARARTTSDRATPFGHSSKSLLGLRSRALVAADSFAPLAAFVGLLLVAPRPLHPASGTLGHFRPLRSCHVAPQFCNASAPLPNQPQFGTVSTTARRRQAAARPPPLFALLPRSPSTPLPVTRIA